MNKIARIQAQSNAIARGEDAALGTVETVILLIAVIAVVAVLFVFLTGKLDTSLDNVGKDIDNASGYVTGSEIPAKA